MQYGILEYHIPICEICHSSLTKLQVPGRLRYEASLPGVRRGPKGNGGDKEGGGRKVKRQWRKEDASRVEGGGGKQGGSG